MADVKWIKITTNIFDDEKMKLIDVLPDRDATLVIWFKLLAMAGKTNDNGLVYVMKEMATTDEVLSTVFNRPINTVRLALETFERFGMIEVNEHISICNWEKHQNIDGLEKIREQNRLRQQKFKEKKKQKQIGNVTVTLGNATEEDKNKNKKEEEEKKKDNNKPKKTTFEKLIEEVKEKGLEFELEKKIIEFIEFRRDIKKPLKTTRSINIMLNNEEFINADHLIKSIDQTIMNGYQGVFPCKLTNNTKPKPKSNNRFLDELKQMEKEEMKNAEID